MIAGDGERRSGPEAAARKLLELAAGVEAINVRIHIEKIERLVLSKGAPAIRAEPTRAIQHAIERNWLDLQESDTNRQLPPAGADLFPRH